MAHKTDIARLLPTLKRLCGEHQAMQALLAEGDPANWRNDVSQLANRLFLRARIDEQFRGFLESTESDQLDALVFEKLIEVLDKTNLQAPHKGQAL
jgi:hypothetical protein